MHRAAGADLGRAPAGRPRTPIRGPTEFTTTRLHDVHEHGLMSRDACAAKRGRNGPRGILPAWPICRSGWGTSTSRLAGKTPRRKHARRCAPASRSRSKLIHCKWSGESTWVPLGDERPDVGFENHTSHPAPGDILIYTGEISECEILFPYGACSFSSRVGQLAGNHFATRDLRQGAARRDGATRAVGRRPGVRAQRGGLTDRLVACDDRLDGSIVAGGSVRDGRRRRGRRRCRA